MTFTTILIFILILAILVLVHEFGHFIVAKLFGIRVDEFGLGFPPRIASFKPKNSETRYSINWIPFGGFVRIFGENPDEASLTGPDSSRSFVRKPKLVQVAVLIAGIVFNLIFAWLVISSGFMIGLPTSADDTTSQTLAQTSQGLTGLKVVISDLLPNSPAEAAGIKVGDTIVALWATTLTKGQPASTIDTLSGSAVTPDSVGQFVIAHGTEPITVTDMRGTSVTLLTITPATGIIPDHPAIGVALEEVGLQKLSFFPALGQGAILTWGLIQETAVGLGQFIGQIFVGKADFSQVSGPVGIAGVVGDARALGFIYLMTLTAFISINLAVINLIPFPALDGGRILFVIIEAIIRRPIKPRIANAINSIGFALIIILMLVVTYKDILKLF